MSKREAWAYKDQDGKWRLTTVRPGNTWRPANDYGSSAELMQEARKRGLEVTWENERD